MILVLPGASMCSRVKGLDAKKHLFSALQFITITKAFPLFVACAIDTATTSLFFFVNVTWPPTELGGDYLMMVHTCSQSRCIIMPTPMLT